MGTLGLWVLPLLALPSLWVSTSSASWGQEVEFPTEKPHPPLNQSSLEGTPSLPSLSVLRIVTWPQLVRGWERGPELGATAGVSPHVSVPGDGEEGRTGEMPRR